MAKHYRYSLRKDSTTYYKVQGGQVITQATPHYFEEGIDSFSQLGVEEYRNSRMDGFYRKISQSSYGFVGDMMKILRYILFTNGPQATVILAIERLSDYRTKTYTLDYETDVNLAKARRELYQFPSELLQAGVEELIKTREDTDYSLDVSGDGLVTINILPFRVRGRSKFMSIEAPGQSGHGPNRVAEQYNWPGYSYINETTVEVLESPNYRPVDYFAPLSAGVSGVVEFGQFFNELGGLGNPEGYILKSNIKLEKVKINALVPIYINNLDSSSVTFRGQIYQADYSGLANWTLIGSSTNDITVAAGNDTSQSLVFNQEFVLEAGKVIHIIVENLNPSVTDIEWQYQAEVPLTIDYEHYTSAFNVTGLNWFKAGKRLVDNMTNSQATFASTLLTQDVSYKDGVDCKPGHIALLSSKSIKGIANPDIKVSYSKYLKATDVMLCAGSGIERVYDSSGNVTSTKVTLEKKSYYYKELRPDGNENLVAELGEPAKGAEASVYFDDENAYSEVHIGYSAADTDDINGPEEYNTTLKMQTSYTKDKKPKELISPISASGMAIYRKFIRYATGQDNDNGNDNDLFVLQYSTVNNNGVYTALYPGEIKSTYNVQGLTDPDRALNMGLSPKRCLIRRAYWEIGFFYDSDPFTEAYKFQFLTLDKNKDLVSQLAGTYFVGEKAPEDLSLLLLQYGQERLFYPFISESSHETPKNVRQLWQGARNGVFAVNIEGMRFLGFPFELHEQNSKPKLYGVRMRLTASQNLYNLR